MRKIWDYASSWPRLVPEAWLAQGRVFAQSQRNDKAAVCLRRVLKLNERLKLPHMGAKVRRRLVCVVYVCVCAVVCGDFPVCM